MLVIDYSQCTPKVKSAIKTNASSSRHTVHLPFALLAKVIIHNPPKKKRPCGGQD